MWNIFISICALFLCFPLSSFAADEDVNFARQFLLLEINTMREKVGVFPLEFDKNLSVISQLHTNDIADMTIGDPLATKDMKTSLIGSDERTTNLRFDDVNEQKEILVEHMQWFSWKDDAHLLAVIEDVFLENSDLFFLQDAFSPVYQSVGIGIYELKKERGGELYLTFSFSGHTSDGSIMVDQNQSFQKWSPYLDMYSLERKWVNEINAIRKINNLSQLIWSSDLTESATDWTRYMVDLSNVTHDRPTGESPHTWIEQYNMPFADDYETNYFTENIVRGVFSCIEGCKYSAFSELQSRVDEFMNEVSYNGSHYRSIMHQDWTHIGVDIEVIGQNEFYGTIHYGRLIPEDYVFLDLDKDHHAAKAIEYFFDKGIISGYADSTVRPEDSITRAEILKLIFLVLFEDEVLLDSSYSFIDVDDDAWYASYIAKAAQYKIINGYSDGTFRPDQSVSKAEALKMILEASKLTVPSTHIESLEDVSSQDWYAPYISFALNEKLLRYGSPLFHPHNPMTRGDVMYALYQLSNK